MTDAGLARIEGSPLKERVAILIDQLERHTAALDGLSDLKVGLSTVRYDYDEAIALLNDVHERLCNSVPAAADAKIEHLKKSHAKLLKAAKAGASALDALMGDSDLDDDKSPEFKACQALNRAVDFAQAKP